MRVLSSGLLLGAAAGLALTSGASAADLPMKAKAPAVQYVKICSLYGAGFYYIPGTDTCLKIGGHLRADAFWGPSGAATESVNFNANYDVKGQRYFYTRARAYATFDARSQTEYGTLRSYFLIGATYDGNGNADAGPGTGVYMIRAFIQLAGFTWGLTTSIFDHYSITPVHLNYVAATNGSVGATGVWQWRYTAQFGGGFSASIAIEEPRVRLKPIFGSVQRGVRWPDVVAQLQASGAWGRVGAALAVHDSTAIGPTVFTTIDNIGWAASVGGLLRIPGLPGDTFGFQFAYAEGATDFVTANYGTGTFFLTKDNKTGTGFVYDGVATSATNVDLVTAWGIEAGFEHNWSKTLKTSIAGGYVQLDYTSASSLAICGAALFALGCRADNGVWNVGSRTQWSPVRNFSLALDVMYSHMDSANLGTGVVVIRNGRITTQSDQNIWTGMIRVRRDFWP